MKTEARWSKTYVWDAADAVLTGSFIVISYLRKKKNLKQPKLTPKGTGEKRTKSKVSRRKEILKILAEINEKQMKKTIEKMNETKSWFFENIKLIKLFQEKMGESSSQ